MRATARWLLPAVMLAGCTGSTELELTLKLSDAVFLSTSSARITVAGSSEAGFPLDPVRHQVADGLFVSNRDADGDGFADIVLDLDSGFAFKSDVKFVLQAGGLATPVNVAVRAETFDAHGNRLARLGGGSRAVTAEHVTALLTPGSRTTAPDLQPSCVGDCSDATARFGQGDVGQAIALGDVPTALVAAAFDVAGKAALAIGAGDAASPATAMRVAQPRSGRVELWEGTGGALTRRAAILGQHAGDRFGAALATADLDGDGVADLIVGAPGTEGDRGAVWILYGPVAMTGELATSASVAHVSDTVAGAQLGAALAAEDLDGDGQPEVIVGAPGAAAVYVLRASSVPKGRVDPTVPGAEWVALTGPAGSVFGTAVAAREGAIAVGAPLDNGVYYLPAGSLATGSHAPSELGGTRWLGDGGGFGAAVALADTDGTGQLTLFAGAPRDGAGRIESRQAAALSGGDADATTGVSSLRGAFDQGALGAGLAVARGGLGDWILFGAAAAPSETGSAYVLPARYTTAATSSGLDRSGRPAGVVVQGGGAGDGFGQLAVAADLNQDGLPDLAVAAAGAASVAVVMGPIL